MSTEPIPNRQNCVQIANPKSIDFYKMNCYHDKITTKKEKIMIDIPPQLEMVIIERAKQHDLSPVSYLEQLFLTNDYDDEPLYDIDRMSERIKGYETKELALKNGRVVPKSALKDFKAFKQWLGQR